MIKLNIEYKNKENKELDIKVSVSNVFQVFRFYNELLNESMYGFSFNDRTADKDTRLKRVDDFLKNFVESNTVKSNTFKLKNLNFNIIKELGFQTINYITDKDISSGLLKKDEVKNIDMIIKPDDREQFIEDLSNPRTYGRFINNAYKDYCLREQIEDLNSDLNKHEWKSIEKRIQNIIDKYSDDLEIIRNESENIEKEEPIDFSKTNKRVMKM